MITKSYIILLLPKSKILKKVISLFLNLSNKNLIVIYILILLKKKIYQNLEIIFTKFAHKFVKKFVILY